MKEKRQGGIFYPHSKTHFDADGRYPEAAVDDTGKHYVYHGSVVGDSVWGNERFLHTSLVVKETDDTIETLNTIYKRGKPQ